MQSKKDKKCIFCLAVKKARGSQIIFKSKYSFCILNIFPYNNGHLMVAPIKHCADITLLKDEEVLDLFRSLKEAKKLLDRVLRPQGYNIGINLNDVAGAGVTGHLHIHIVPRWKGDTNFMPIIGNTKVISQSLKELFKQLINERKKTNI